MCQVSSYRTVVGSYRMVVLLTHFYQRKLFVYSINVLMIPLQHNGHVVVLDPLLQNQWSKSLNVCLQELHWPTLSSCCNYLSLSIDV